MFLCDCSIDSFLCNLKVFLIEFDADEVSLGVYASDTCTAGTHSIIENNLTFICVCLDKPFQECYRLLGGVVKIPMFLLNAYDTMRKLLVGKGDFALLKIPIAPILPSFREAVPRPPLFYDFSPLYKIEGYRLAALYKKPKYLRESAKDICSR